MSEKRKHDHIRMAFSERSEQNLLPPGIHYEPLLSPHPTNDASKCRFLGFDLDMPLWISSMTGGAHRAKSINENLARACKDFNIGMGLGSCRPLLDSDERWVDFDIRKFMGESAPLFTNFGVAQLEQLIAAKKINQITEITKRLAANGVIIHVNPLQEWAQAEGDRYNKSPLDTIKYVCDAIDLPIIVKEVGQGMGPKSLEALSQLPVSAIELAAFGGTNFTLIEQARNREETNSKLAHSNNFGNIGHTIEQMLDWQNSINPEMEVIISGGVTDPLQGHIYRCHYRGNSVIGMASSVLKYAMGDYQQLFDYLNNVKEQFSIAQAYIREE